MLPSRDRSVYIFTFPWLSAAGATPILAVTFHWSRHLPPQHNILTTGRGFRESKAVSNNATTNRLTTNLLFIFLILLGFLFLQRNWIFSGFVRLYQPSPNELPNLRLQKNAFKFQAIPRYLRTIT
jgi:hypothetical protein